MKYQAVFTFNFSIHDKDRGYKETLDETSKYYIGDVLKNINNIYYGVKRFKLKSIKRRIK